MRAFAPILVGVALLAAVPLITASNVVLNFLVMALLIALVGQGWNLLGGYGGQYSFGHAAFFGTGAYAPRSCRCATASTPGWGSSSASQRARWSAPSIGALSFRSGLKGSYFALVTLAFAEVLRIIASVTPITGAGVGTLIKLDLRPEAFQFQSRAPFYWIMLGLVGVSLILVRVIEESRFGAYLVAVRENEDAAKALGVDATRRQARRHDDLRRDHRGGRLLLCAVFSVHRCRHRLWAHGFRSRRCSRPSSAASALCSVRCSARSWSRRSAR